jgi:hypothetical protein
MGRKTTMMKETTWLAVTMAAIGGLSFVMLPEPVQADDSMVASMHPVDPAAKRVSERTVGTVTFAPGKAAGETSMAVRLED